MSEGTCQLPGLLREWLKASEVMPTAEYADKDGDVQVVNKPSLDTESNYWYTRWHEVGPEQWWRPHHRLDDRPDRVQQQPDYRALCAELIALGDETPNNVLDWACRWNLAVKRTREALAKKPTADQEPVQQKPPLGLRPLEFAVAERQEEVRAAIKRYEAAGKDPEVEWISELEGIDWLLGVLRKAGFRASATRPRVKAGQVWIDRKGRRVTVRKNRLPGAQYPLESDLGTPGYYCALDASGRSCLADAEADLMTLVQDVE